MSGDMENLSRVTTILSRPQLELGMSQNQFKKLHGIQLVSVETRELFIRLNGPVEIDVESMYRDHVQIDSGHSPFNQETSNICVGLRAALGVEEDSTLPVSMKIEVVGLFNVNLDEFPEGQIESWANRNAPIILYPFIREHGVALTVRCGLPPLILPLIQVPTLEKI